MERLDLSRGVCFGVRRRGDHWRTLKIRVKAPKCIDTHLELVYILVPE